MAYGGMRGEGIPIGRRALAGVPAAAPAEREPLRGGHRAEPPIHCWVHSATGGGPGSDDTRSPGVLVEWRHDGTRWWGMVVFVVDEGPGPAVVTRLMPAESLSPA